MPKVFFCSNCSLQHARPVGKRCQQMPGESFSGDVDVPAPSSPSSLPPSVSAQILTQLQQLGDKMDQMDRRVQRTEAALEQGSTQASTSASSAASHSNNLVGGSTTESAMVESVVPSIDYLRTNDSLQSEVERHLAELRNINELATTKPDPSMTTLLSPNGYPDSSDASRRKNWKPIRLVCSIIWVTSWRMHLIFLGTRPKQPMLFS